MANRIVLNETSYFGPGSISVLPDEIKKRGFNKAFVVTDKDLVRFGVTQKVLDVLDGASLSYSVFDETKQNPNISNVQNGVAAIKATGADFIIAIGGGSPIDTAKAIGIIMTNPDFADVRSLEGVAATRKPSLPIIAIPTTAGTAAEVTINYVITDEENKRKFVCVDPHDIPVLSIVDPDMMASMPKDLAAATGMDALTHAIEGYLTNGAWEMSDMFELKAISMIASSLRKSVLEGSPDARNKMGIAQYIAGMGFSNVGLGLVHGMAHPLGAFYDTPHGVANAVLLPVVMEYNAEVCGEKYRDIAPARGGAGTECMDEAAYKAAAVDAVRRLSQDIGIPSSLSELGVRTEDLPALSDSAFADVCTPGNPRKTTKEEILALYQKAMQP